SSLAAHADFVGQYANSSLKPVSNFIPRPELHRKIKEQLYDQNDNDETPILVVYGLGGSGKSQLVLNYIRECRHNYTAIFWIEAESKETIERDYIQIYRLLYGRQTGSGQETVKVEDAVPAVKRWFNSREGRSLVVLDSADTIDNDQDNSYINLNYFLPDAPRLHIIITSRSSTAQELTWLEAVQVGEMKTFEATELFKRSAKLIGINPDEEREIRRIVEELGYLALAITLAGSYVSVTPRLSSDIGKYLPEYRQRRKELFQRRPKQHAHRYRESVMTTWEASFEAITAHNPVAARLLSLLAFLHFEDIFFDLFNGDEMDSRVASPEHAADGSDVPTSTHQTWRSFLSNGEKWILHDLENSFETLQNYSLLQWRSDQRSYAMHKLVRAWGQDRLGGDEQRQLSGLALELIADATGQKKATPNHLSRLVPHAITSFRTSSQLHQAPGEIAQNILLRYDTIGQYFHRIGRWSEAHEVQLFHFTKANIVLGKEHPDTMASMSGLAVALDRLGKHKEAEQIHQQTLALRHTVLGEEHPDTLTSMNNLALVLNSLGKYEETEQLYRQALALSRTVRGEEHPNTLISITNLGWTLSNSGQYKETEQILRQVLPLMQRLLGEEHPTTLTTMANLAITCWKQDQLEEAEELGLQVMETQIRVLGEEHPSTLTSMSSLARTFKSQDRNEEAISLMKKCFQLREKVIGPGHPRTEESLKALNDWVEESTSSGT
ncbi:MAG: hypothetical protein Q9167_007873, partial [Letrouitia subvulpina]